MDRTIRLSFSLCSGVLLVWWYKKGAHDAYEALTSRIDTEQASDFGIFVTYERDDMETPVESVPKLFAVIRANGCLPAEEARKEPVGFAVTIGLLLRRERSERVIEEAEFWEFLDAYYGVTSSELTPRVEGDSLRFTIVALGVDPPVRYIRKCSVDLNSGTAEEIRIEPLSK